MLVAGYDGDVPSFASQAFDGVEDGLVFGCGCDEMLAAPLSGERNSFDSKVI